MHPAHPAAAVPRLRVFEQPQPEPGHVDLDAVEILQRAQRIQLPLLFRQTHVFHFQHADQTPHVAAGRPCQHRQHGKIARPPHVQPGFEFSAELAHPLQRRRVPGLPVASSARSAALMSSAVSSGVFSSSNAHS